MAAENTELRIKNEHHDTEAPESIFQVKVFLENNQYQQALDSEYSTNIYDALKPLSNKLLVLSTGKESIFYTVKLQYKENAYQKYRTPEGQSDLLAELKITIEEKQLFSVLRFEEELVESMLSHQSEHNLVDTLFSEKNRLRQAETGVKAEGAPSATP
ncbi:MAG: hypothetical protein K0U12_07185 [Gammaproteobacteria bacterium]|nr:hypothetical protein [Gammaproteobacteria bacterium]